MPFKSAQTYEDDGKWKVIMTKEMAHTSGILAVTTYGNLLYSTSKYCFKIWDLEKMQPVSDIAV
jgi:hypothetical protein